MIFGIQEKLRNHFLLSGSTVDLYAVGKVDKNADLFDYTLKDKSSPWGTTNILFKNGSRYRDEQSLSRKKGKWLLCATGIKNKKG